MYETKTKEQPNYDIAKFVNNHMFIVKNMKEVNAVFEAWAVGSRKYPNDIALKDDYSKMRVTYKDAYEKIIKVAAALQSIGLKKFSHVAFFSENNARWMLSDQAVMMCGAVNSVRSSSAPLDELKYIYEHSDSTALFTDSKKLILDLNEFLAEKKAKFVVYLGNEDMTSFDSCSVDFYTFADLLARGQNNEFVYTRVDREDLATIVYSSGTTGRPKGIMLTHGNLVSQLLAIHERIPVGPRNSVLSILPVWHMYERTVEYYMIYCGATICYTNLRKFKQDIKKFRADFLVGVPRLWESIYEGIMNNVKTKTNIERGIFFGLLNLTMKYRQAKNLLKRNTIACQHPTNMQLLKANIVKSILSPIAKIARKSIFARIKKEFGGKFPLCISGGGALSHEVENFFDTIGIPILIGYGLTETSPILTVRTPEKNRLNTAGYPLPDTEISIVDPDKLTLMPKGEKGLVLAKGPQIMKGYYKDNDATSKVLLRTGWFITGDLGWVSDDGFLILTGRAKDIIVLSNGENIEPDVIEQACCLSDYVKQIVLVGQDKSCLGALIKTDHDAVVEWAQKNGVKEETAEKDPCFKKMLLKELNTRIANRPNFRPFERLGNIKFVDEGFTIENGLMTFTAKIRKNVVFEKYKKAIDDMYKL